MYFNKQELGKMIVLNEWQKIEEYKTLSVGRLHCARYHYNSSWYKNTFPIKTYVIR